MTARYIEIRSPADHLALSEDLRRLDEWADTWQMIFKSSKCYMMSITNKRKPSLHTYKIKGGPLSTVTTHTYLGVDIDSKLTWTPHCNKVKKRATQTLGLVQRTLHAAPRACKEMAYKTLVKPKLEYATTAWSPQTSGKIKQLESVQKKAARFVTRQYSREVRGDKIVQDLSWDTLETRRAAKSSIPLVRPS